MPKVMIRRDSQGDLSLYVPKKDLEERVVALEHSGPQQWGGALTLADGSRFEIETFDVPPSLPVTVRAKRLDD